MKVNIVFPLPPLGAEGPRCVGHFARCFILTLRYVARCFILTQVPIRGRGSTVCRASCAVFYSYTKVRGAVFYSDTKVRGAVFHSDIKN